MKLKKVTALMLTLAIAVGSLAGCGGSAATSTTKTEEGTKTTDSGTFEKANITMMTYDYSGSPVSGEHSDEVLAQMEEYTNTKVDFTWVPDDNYEDKLSLTLASADDMPMIISVSKMSAVIVGAAKAGAFWDLKDYMFDAQKYPNLSQANESVNEGVTIDGQLIGVYKARPIGRNGLGYRADWAEKLGLSAPTTIEDVYNMMYQFTYGDPDGNGVDDTYGLALCKYTGPFDIMQTWFGVGNQWVEKDGKLVPTFQTEEYMEALKWIKKMYDDGLVYEDWAVRDTATWADSVKNGECGMFIDVLDGARKIWDYFEDQKVPSVVDASKPASMNLIGSIEGKTLATSGNNGFFVITKAADTEEKLAACLNYLDKMCSDEMITLATYGIKDVHWNLDEEGYLIDLDAGDEVSTKAYQALNQTIPFIPNLKALSPVVKTNERIELEEKVKKENEAVAVFNPAISYLNNSDTYSLSGSTLDKIIDDARTQYICGQIDEAGLQAAWDNWLTQGGKNVIEEVNAQYTATK
ncbi:extracellular solute-binding protein [Candidatus Galacturonibacter soehngenii]|uniref:Extracellular solute-binding protein n=1 Tax=Candidatus Galacturonatibacter soehngenii TaxID=2307010 RepID=A0A7V7QN42_9FIRM|nr:extracellular solute-binding protein [Candidatus Galacturonibacter soehngenii]KAB1440078.1 extracellular solute-binding protein [Candidatus Galacturonibacter soehngenii]MBA4686094.1 extracellular solute-binding protein [Candidatus Galacturonibacter soehngenii]